jgi:O-antigen/teichoic acid export membrane protein
MKLLQFEVSSKLIKDYLYYSSDFGFRIFVQLGYFAIISRTLGSSAYGIFSSITAVTILAASFAGLGAEQVLVRRAAGKREEFPSAFGHTLICFAFSSVPIAAICYGVLQFMNVGEIPWWAVLTFVITEIFFTKLVAIANICFMSQEIVGRQFLINVTVSVIKLVGAVLAWLLSSPLTLHIWALWYFGSTAIGGIVAIGLVLYELGFPVCRFYPKELRDGFQYGFEVASVVALRDLDKSIVVETLGPAIGGQYTAAFRVVDAASLPIRALLLATYTRYFRHAKVSPHAVIAFGMRVLPIGLTMSIILSVCLFILAWTVPFIIGSSYGPTVSIIRWLAIYPIVFTLASTGMDMLRSFGQLGPRLRITLLSTVTYLPICWVGALVGGAVGVAIARSGSQLVIAAMTWRAIHRRTRGC